MTDPFYTIGTIDPEDRYSGAIYLLEQGANLDDRAACEAALRAGFKFYPRTNLWPQFVDGAIANAKFQHSRGELARVRWFRRRGGGNG